MCGIAGIVTNQKHQADLKAQAMQMQRGILHRGPDDQGYFQSPNAAATLVHTRLAILDLSSAGHQPMQSQDGRYTIVFNGEIYNFQVLRAELEQKGETFATHTDTEVLLRLFQRQGVACLAKLRGMFSFAIWDEQEQECFLARDANGIKPLYYWHKDGKLLFASEMRALLDGNLIPFKLDAQGLYGYLLTGAVLEPDTLIEGVKSLEAGYWLRWRNGNISTGQYWQINFWPEQQEQFTLESARELARHALTESVRDHLVSDVPVGIFLSGGIDSTAILALIRQFRSDKVRTYSIAFEEDGWNEGKIAHRISQAFATEHTEQVITATSGRALLAEYIAAMDQPTVDGYNTFCVSKLTRADGTKVALSGLGGDELFNGYSSFRRIPQMLRWGKRLNPFLPRFVGHAIERWSGSGKVRRMGAFLQDPGDAMNCYYSVRGLFSPREARQIVSHYLPEAQAAFKVDSSYFAQPTLEDQVSALESAKYMRNQLLRDSDVMSMAFALEVRVPFVDRVLIDSLARIPAAIRLSLKKGLLVKAVPELPEWVVNRPKQGFSFPFDRWMANGWSDLFSNVGAVANGDNGAKAKVNNVMENIPLNHWYRRWVLVMLNHWLRRYA